jgi:hypothetical protein
MKRAALIKFFEARLDELFLIDARNSSMIQEYKISSYSLFLATIAVNVMILDALVPGHSMIKEWKETHLLH